MKLSKVEIRTPKEGAMTPMNCEILIDGIPIKGIRKFAIQLEATGRNYKQIAVLKLEVISEIKISGELKVKARAQEKPE